MKKNQFTLADFNKKYPTENACLKEIFNRKFSHLKECPKCGKPFKYYKVSDRKCYVCQYCANQIHPLANTIFHKSDTPLKSWFYAIFLFSVSKNGVSAMSLSRASYTNSLTSLPQYFGRSFKLVQCVNLPSSFQKLSGNVFSPLMLMSCQIGEMLFGHYLDYNREYC